jgi:uncharacterized protein (UPF0332 family)
VNRDEQQAVITEALTRADEAMRAARALAASGLLRDAVSRGYYAALHHVRAVLLARGLEARTHGGMFQLLHREFIKPGLLIAVPGWQLAGLQRSRELADYDASVSFTASEVESLLQIVELFASDVRTLLRRDGHLPA